MLPIRKSISAFSFSLPAAAPRALALIEASIVSYYWYIGIEIIARYIVPVKRVYRKFPNGSVLEAANPETLKAALRAWKESVDNPQGHPKVVFPISVEYEDGSQVEVASRDELIALKDTCDTD